MRAAAGPLRPVRREPGIFALIALTVAVAVGIATALYGYLDFWLHPRVTAPHAERIVATRIRYPDWVNWNLSSQEVAAAKSSRAYELAAANASIAATVAAPGGNVFAWGLVVDGDYFELWGGSAALGRLLTESDDRPDSPPVVVLSNRLWRTAFASDPTVVGSSVTLNGEPYTVLGVAARGFEGIGYSSEFFAPLHCGDRLAGSPRSRAPWARWLQLHGRLPTGPDALQLAQSQLEVTFAALSEQSPLPEGESRQPLIVPESALAAEFRHDPEFVAARFLAGAGALFVLLGASNLAALVLARASARGKEWAMRRALGASPARIARTMVGLTIAPTAVGLAGAVLVAEAARSWLDGMLKLPNAGFGPNFSGEHLVMTQISWRAWCFAFAAAIVTVGLTVLPSLVRVLRRDVHHALRSGSAGGGSARAALAPRRTLVALQLALAIALLVGSGLLVRSLRAAADGELGFDPHGLSFASLSLPVAAGAEGAAERDRSSAAALLDRLRDTPGIDAAALALVTPFTCRGRGIGLALPESPDRPQEASYTIVTPGYFEVVGTTIVAGRPLDLRDTPSSPPVVVVSASLARRFWGDTPAVGRKLHVTQPTPAGESGPDFEVVGVAADAAYVSPIEPRPPMIFFAYGQRRHQRMTLLFRASAPLARVEPAIRAALGGERPDASVIDLVSGATQLGRTLRSFRLNATVATALGLAGGGTALLGLFGLQLYSVQLRRRDFALRLAIGARGTDLSRLVLAEASRLALLGAVAGLATAAAAVRLIRSLLFGISPHDPWAFLAMPALLIAAVLLASWIPARRAARIDPAENLRAL